MVFRIETFEITLLNQYFESIPKQIFFFLFSFFLRIQNNPRRISDAILHPAAGRKLSKQNIHRIFI